MLLSELHAYYGTYTHMSRVLNLGNTTYLCWKRQGYIPLRSQLFIEHLTLGRFKASLKHGKPLAERPV